MVRTQIQLTEEQAKTLKQIAARQNVSMAEVIRKAINQFAGTAAGTGTSERKQRALKAAGRFRSGIKDLASEHDKHLADTFGR